jgi:hypothetical protein
MPLISVSTLMGTTTPTPAFGYKTGVLRHRLILTQILASSCTFFPKQSMAVSSGHDMGCGVGSPPPERSSSPKEEETDRFYDEFIEFAILISEDPFGPKRLPEKCLRNFSPAGLHMREATCGFCMWHVDVLFDGVGQMSPHTVVVPYYYLLLKQTNCGRVVRCACARV